MPPKSKKRRQKDGDPWTFTAGLHLEFTSEIRQVMDLLYSAFLPYRWPWDQNKINPRYLPRDQRREVKRMLEECVGNDLLTNITYWFATKYCAEDDALFDAVDNLKKYASFIARHPETYPGMYEEAKEDWWDFIDKETEKGDLTRWYGNTIKVHISEIDDGEETEEDPEPEPVKTRKVEGRKFEIFQRKTRSDQEFFKPPPKRLRSGRKPENTEAEKPEPEHSDVETSDKKNPISLNRTTKKPTSRKASGVLKSVETNIKTKTQVPSEDEPEDDIPLHGLPMINRIREKLKTGSGKLTKAEIKWLEEYDSDSLPLDLWKHKKNWKGNKTQNIGSTKEEFKTRSKNSIEGSTSDYELQMSNRENSTLLSDTSSDVDMVPPRRSQRRKSGVDMIPLRRSQRRKSGQRVEISSNIEISATRRSTRGNPVQPVEFSSDLSEPSSLNTPTPWKLRQRNIGESADSSNDLSLLSPLELRQKEIIEPVYSFRDQEMYTPRTKIVESSNSASNYDPSATRRSSRRKFAKLAESSSEPETVAPRRLKKRKIFEPMVHQKSERFASEPFQPAAIAQPSIRRNPGPLLIEAAPPVGKVQPKPALKPAPLVDEAPSTFSQPGLTQPIIRRKSLSNPLSLNSLVHGTWIKPDLPAIKSQVQPELSQPVKRKTSATDKSELAQPVAAVQSKHYTA